MIRCTGLSSKRVCMKSLREVEVCMTAPLISCIIPVFNGERYLREAVDSILQQTYRPLEVILIDDGSTDGTAAVAAGYEEQITYLRQSNAGPAAARNLGLSVARGEFLAFLDADDLWHQEKLACQMARFATRPELEWCLTYLQNFWIAELSEEAAKWRNHQSMQPLPGYLLQTLLAKRTVFDSIGQFNPQLSIGEETDWFLRAIEQQTVMEMLPDVLVYRRFHYTNRTYLEMSQNRGILTHIIKASLDRRRLNKYSVEPLKLPSSQQSGKT